MSTRRRQQIVTLGVGPQIAVGTRVNTPTNEKGTGLDVVPDPNGRFVVVSCEPGLIEIEEIDAH